MTKRTADFSFIKRIFLRISDFAEYILILAIILECNSLYILAVKSDVNMTDIFTNICMVLLVFLISVRLIITIAEGKMTGRHAWNLFGIPIIVLAYGVLVYFLNVLALEPGSSSSFIQLFLFVLPMFVLFFRIKREEGQIFDLIFKYSDIICFFCIVNLVAYIASTVNPDAIPSDVVYTHWSNSGSLDPRINLLNICTARSSTRWQIAGIRWLRNYGIFAEPLIFSIGIVTSLYTELFLRPSVAYKKKGKNSGLRIMRCILLSLVMLSAQAVYGILLMLLAWSIKILQVLVRKKRRILVIPVIVVLILAGTFFVVQKQNISYESDGYTATSTDDHLDDVRIGIDAFLSKPLTGGGYGNGAYLRSFMSEERLARNSGFSNTAFAILGQGGILFGFFCWFPYIIFLLQIFNKNRNNKKIGLWGIGVFGIFLFIVFTYHYYLIMLLGLGYSLVDIQKGKKAVFRISLFPEQTLVRSRSKTAVNRKRASWKTLRTAGIVFAAVVAFMIFAGTFVWNGLYRLLNDNQMLLGQFPLNSFCMWLVIFMNIYIVKTFAAGKCDRSYVIVTAVHDIVWALAYVRAVTLISTVSAIRESACADKWPLLLLYFYAGGWVLMALLFKTVRRWNRAALQERALEVSGFAVVFTLFAASFTSAEHTIANFVDTLGDQSASVRTVTDNASGKVFSNNLPYLYYMTDHLDLSAAKDEGFSFYKDASVICTKGTVLHDLFDRGYEVTDIGNNLIVYTNDQDLIDNLSEDGYAFYRYYSYRRDVNLNSVAKSANKKISSEGLIIEENNPLYQGPSDVLNKGQYTVEYSLHRDSRDSSKTVLCTLEVTSNYGAATVASTDVTADQFDQDGNAVIKVSFSLSDLSEGVDYRIYPQNGSELYCDRISLQETPDYITLSRYNGHMQEIRSEYYNTDGTPYSFLQGYSAVNRTYNRGDQLMSVSYELDGQPAVISWGYAGIKYTYNNQGSIIREDYLDTDGNPFALRQGYAALEREYDKYGHDIADRYLDEENNPVATTSGYSEIRYTYDSQNRITRMDYCDADGKRVMRTEGYSALSRELDENGYAVEQTYLDNSGNPVVTNYGYASIHYTYNDRGNPVREEYYDKDGGPVSNIYGYAALERTCDTSGNITDERYYDTSGKKAANNEGYAEIKRTYNKKNQNTQEIYYDIYGNKTASTGGYYGIKRKYDAAGNVSEIIYLDGDGDPAASSSGVAIIRYTYDSYRNCIAEYYYNNEETPVENVDGCSEVHRTFDGYDEVSETRLNLRGEELQ